MGELLIRAGSGSPLHRPNLHGDAFGTFAFRLLHVEGTLQVQPELRGRIEIACESQGRVGRDGTAFADDVVDPWRWHVQRHRQRIGTHFQRHEKFLAEDFAGVNRAHGC